MIARLDAALAARDGEAGAHCVHELWMRGAIGFEIDSMLARLWRHAADSIPAWLPMRHVDWLATVYDVTSAFASERRGRHNVYLVLLDYADRGGHPYGIYVGMTHYRPAERFDQHKAGIRASGSVLRRGVEVLAGPALHLQRIARAEAERIEAELAVALRTAGLVVRGGH